MAAAIEGNNVFSVREPMWHGLGHILTDAPSWDDIPQIINCNWKAEKVNAIQKLPNGITSNLQVVDLNTGEVYGYIRELENDFEVRRDKDGQHYGFVKDTYVPLQNDELIELMIAMAGEGAVPETGGMLFDGKTIFITCKSETTIFAEEKIAPYFVLTNTHGGGGAIRAAFVPLRIVCANTLSAGLKQAVRSYVCRHTTNVKSRVDEAIRVLQSGGAYMEAIGNEVSTMKLAKITPEKAKQVLDQVVIQETASKLAKIEALKKTTPINRAERIKNLEKIEKLQADIYAVQGDLYTRYFDAPDLQHLGHSQFRLWNAISDYATHTDLHKKTKEYNAKLFMASVNDNSSGKAKLIDLGYKMAKAA